MRRIFVAINFPEDLKGRIARIVEELRPKFDLTNIRFLEPENWHITVSFLGYQDDDSIGRIVEAVGEVGAQLDSFSVQLEKIMYGPPKSPRMIWLTGSRATSDRLQELRNGLEDVLADKGVRFRRESRQFNIHITLARFENVDRLVLPKIDRLFSESFIAESLDVMESNLKRSGAEYTILSSGKFQDTI